MKLKAILSAIILILCSSAYIKANNCEDNAGYDGPYVCYTDSFIKVLYSKDGKLTTEYFDKGNDSIRLNVISNSGEYSFDVDLIKEKKRSKWNNKQYEKTLVMSDPHGNIDFVIKTLRGNNVINKELNWAFGKNHLVVLGDIFDRGNDVTQIFWLIYKLQQEATNAGGKVSFLLGNHEPMVLSNDMRYAEDKYKAIADTLGINYSELFSKDTELGRWLETCNTIEVYGKYLFVHAGIGQQFYKENIPIETVNKEISNVLFLKNKERKATSKVHAFLYGSEGPIWYRGLVRDKEKYHPCPADTLSLLMKRFGVKKIIVGHTKNDDITEFYNGKVIGVNVENDDNLEEKKGLGILIDKKRIFVVGENDIIREL